MNNEEQQEELNEEQSQSENGPGHLLMKKREVLGMTVHEVADALHITMHYVKALEEDAHDKLPGDVFIKGYLRSYANLLQLDPTVIINVYLDYSSERANAELVSHTRRRRGNKHRIPWIAVSGVAFVGMAIALWYFSSGGTSPTRSSAAAANVTNNSTRTISPSVAFTLDEVATTVAVPSSPEMVQPSSSNNVDEPAQIEVAQDLAAPIDDVPSAGDSQNQSQPAPESEVIPERLISVDGGGEDLVQITFTGESTVQVDDANDEQLYSDLRVAGDVLRISGTAPFNILLGDASNSELSFNGSKVDFSSSIRVDNSARLIIGL